MAKLVSKTIFLLFVVCCLLFAVFLPGCGETDADTDVTSVVVSPVVKTLGVNKTQLFTATAKNSLGQIISATITWTKTGTGSISSTGIYTAGAASGEATVYATSSNGVTGEALVTVTETGWISGAVCDSIGNKVQDLKVYLLGYENSLYDLTNASGLYSIANVPYGTYEVWTKEVPSVYRASSAEAFVASGETTTVNFTILYFTDPPDTNPPEFP